MNPGLHLKYNEKNDKLYIAAQESAEAAKRGGADGGCKPPTAAAAPCTRRIHGLLIADGVDKCDICGCQLL